MEMDDLNIDTDAPTYLSFTVETPEEGIMKMEIVITEHQERH
jgi:hypothetical protein